MTPMAQVIQRVVEKLSSANGFKKAWIEKHWKEIVGEQASKHSYPAKTEHEVLVVNVDSSAWNQELFMNKGKILNKINHPFSKKIIIEIKCKIGPIVEEKEEEIRILPEKKSGFEERTSERVRESKDLVFMAIMKKKHAHAQRGYLRN